MRRKILARSVRAAELDPQLEDDREGSKNMEGDAGQELHESQAEHEAAPAHAEGGDKPTSHADLLKPGLEPKWLRNPGSF